MEVSSVRSAHLIRVLMSVFVVTGCGGSDIVQPEPDPVTQAVYNQIIFESDRDDPNGDLYLMDLDGSNMRRIASTAFVESCPVFSPDGTRIAFHSTRLGNQLSLYVMHSDGTSVRYVDGPVRRDECPRWSADASRIGYVRDDRSSISATGVMRIANANGSSVRTIDSAARFIGPALSMNGDQVLYHRFDLSPDSLRSGIFVAASGGGTSRRIAASYDSDASIDWSRDGKLVLYGCVITPRVKFGLCVSSPDGSNRSVIAYPFDNFNFQDAHFSPDATFIVNANLSVSVFPMSGAPLTYLHDGVTPTWLSDGSAVGFVSPPKFPDKEAYNPADIFVGGRDGTGVRNLTNHPATDIHPSWSPIRH